MTEVSDSIDPQEQHSESMFSRIMRSPKKAIVYIKANKKKLFWWWIAYQCIKGTLTTSLIWVPLLLVWFGE